MRKTLLLATLLVASVFTAKAQLTLSNSAEVLPRSDWYADLIPYDMTVVAQALGFADAAELDQALLGYVKGENNDFTITNISKAGNETTTNTGDAANYWHWDQTISDWVLVTRGCFWLDVNGEEVGWTSPAYYWTEVDWSVDENNSTSVSDRMPTLPVVVCLKVLTWLRLVSSMEVHLSPSPRRWLSNCPKVCPLTPLPTSTT